MRTVVESAAAARCRIALAFVFAVLGLLTCGAYARAATSVVPDGLTARIVAKPTTFSHADTSPCEEGQHKAGENEHCDTYVVLVSNAAASTLPGPVTIDLKLESSSLSVPVHAEGESGTRAATLRDFAAGYNELGYNYQTEYAEEHGEPNSNPLKCHAQPVVSCVDEHAISAGDVLEMRVHVVVSGSEPTVTASAEVIEGGTIEGASTTGGQLRAQTQPLGTTVLSETQDAKTEAERLEDKLHLGIQDFAFQAVNETGAPDEHADAHPYAITTSFDLTTTLTPIEQGVALGPATAIEEAKEVAETLPLGFVGDPLATSERCPYYKLKSAGGTGAENAGCPATSEIGVLSFDIGGAGYGENNSVGGANSEQVSPVYDMAPEKGYPAVLGFTVLGQPILLYANVVRTVAGYGLRVSARVPRAFRGGITGLQMTLWGTPYQESHDLQREQLNSASGEGEYDLQPPAGVTLKPFLTNPSDCAAGAIDAKLEVDTWQDPERWVTAESNPNSYEALEGCGLLAFAPSLDMHPEASSTTVDTPAGYEVSLKVPQAAEEPFVPATPDLRDAHVTLPPGVSVSPSAATGLAGCEPTGPEAINLGSDEIGPRGQDLGDPEATELGEGHAGPGGNLSSYDDGIYHLAAGHCPQASQIGTVSIKTPLLEEELHGHVYLAEPQCGGNGQPACTEALAEEGKLFGIYLEAAGSGVIVKLPGSVEAGGYGQHSRETGLSPGQLRATFDENPQLPFSELTLKFTGGQRAPLANPQACGSYTTSSAFSSWSGASTSSQGSAFAIGGCSGTTPFSPTFSAGTSSTQGGAFTDFLTTFSRSDGQQDFAGVTVNTPPGLLGIVKNVTECPEAQANAGSCGAESQIGTATVTAGAGSEPYVLSGNVYFTGPYKGSPFGLSIAVPAVAGPFNLGLEVVRAAIAVNPTTAALTIVSNPLPQYKDGVQLRLQTINVNVDRPNFILNPTNCDQQVVSATLTGNGGSSVPVSTPFAASHCASLPFSPKLTASTKSFTSPKKGAAFKVHIGYSSGQANIKRVDVTLPHKFSARLEPTLKHACTEAQFAANPAGCPQDSFAGTAKAITPILAVPLEGPAIFVSHGGAKFPDLDLVLQGQGVTIILKGNTEIKGKTTYSRFETVPDAPVSSFEVNLPEGSHSALSPNLSKRTDRSFCGSDLLMPTKIEGQNGAVIEKTTKVDVEGCKPTLRILSHEVHGGAVKLVVSVPGAGVLKASGKYLRGATARPNKAKDVTLKLTLTKRGRTLLSTGSKKLRKLAIELAFSQKHGKRITKQTTIVLTRKGGSR